MLDDPRPSDPRGPSAPGAEEIAAEARALAARIRQLAGAAAPKPGEGGRRPALISRGARKLASVARRGVSRWWDAGWGRRAPGSGGRETRAAARSAAPGGAELVPPEDGGPLVSVVVPTFDRRRDLARALDAWGRQEPPGLRFELVAVDDGSSDGTAEVLAGWGSERFPLRFGRQPNRGPAAARNRALEMASAPLVLFTGDDIEPTPTLLAEHVRAHRELADPGAAVVGRVAWPPGAPATATMRHVDGRGAQQFSFHWMVDGEEYDFRHFYTSNVSLRRSLLDRAEGGFSTDFPAAAFEDAELAYRLVPHGLRIVYRAEALAYHHHRYDAAGFYRRQLRCGRMAVVLERRFPETSEVVGVAEVRRAARDLERAGARRRAGVRAVAAELDRIEAGVVALAGACDGLSDETAEPLLWAAFHLAYVRGAAGESLEDLTAREVAAAAVVDRVLPSLERLAATIAHR